MVKVLPAILEKDFASVKRAWRRWEKITDWAQIDVVDGKFASNKTFNDIEKLSKIKSKLKIEVHLMVKEPRQQIADWVKLPAVKRVIFHLETTTEPMELIQLIHRAGRQAGAAINPEKRVAKLKPLMSKLEIIQVMGIKPGRQGRVFKLDTLKKIKTIRRLKKDVLISVDGGVNAENAPKIITAGADILVSGSYLKKSNNPKMAMKQLLQSAKRR